MTKENMISFNCINKSTFRIPAKIDDNINFERERDEEEEDWEEMETD